MKAAETFPAAYTIRNRRGVKQFKSDAVPEELIGELLMPGEKLVGMLQIGYPEAMPDHEERRIAADQKWTVVRSASLTKDDFSDGTIGRSAQ
ncbi:hypothetical protein [Paenibacillus contaminans]|uniref:Uncharacterized protein n=1 Tax=Paenibacillus contaminans TaxID=450362 RepID=A0A329MTJ7_9BACL|nr:hypothetical protein [Paenibacillus contaminans]RAV23285.1 hypothetical protein DQG23_03580 [Paenibacillus contaminans]